ncbi:MAG: RICIN domain-containing protein, partial [Phaeodactylibacter sp.]|nr:RICIN domain-containing protein [Phaeodactylibacter sp.]
RTPEGAVQAFGGTSERQAATTTYNSISKDRVVYYDGHGPQREFVLEMPGGTGYWTGQSNAERVIDITWGDDIQPLINGRYKLVNRNSGLVMEIGGDPNTDGTNVQQGTYAGATTQHWDITPVDSRIGGDFSYYRIISVANDTKSLDLYGYSLDNGSNLDIWETGNGGNHQWFLDYAGDGWFYIRSRESAKCVDVYGASTVPGGNIAQWEVLGGLNQQWRLLPIDAPIEFDAPGAPGNLTATANAVSIQLDWIASPDADVTGYHIFRAESAAGPYNTIARNVTATSFVDNTTLSGATYYYAVKAIDQSMNRSDYSNQTSGAATGNDALVMHLEMEGNTRDTSINLNHSAAYGGTSFIGGGVGAKSLVLNGTDAFLQLPADVANHQEITVATWVYWNGGNAWQRIFDFGNGAEEYLFMTPSTAGGQLQFGILYDGIEQNLYAPALPTGALVHVAVTLGASGIHLYVDGQEVAQTASATISPLDFKPILNYIGRSQYPDPLFNGRIDDFRIYNYELPPSEIVALANATVDQYTTVEITSGADSPTSLSPIPVTITFSENVIGFELTDIVVTNGTAGNLQEVVSGSTWTVDITPLTDGIVTVEIAAAIATDLLGNPNEAAEPFNIEYLQAFPVTAVNWIGNTTTWGNNGPQDLSVAFDGDFNTHVDGYTYWGFLGYDFGEGSEVTAATWKYAPRNGWAWRMNGSELRGSNSSDYLNDFDVLYTVSDNPAEGVLTAATITSTTAYRYIYWFDGAYSFANIAEFELYDAGNTQLIGTPVGFEGGSPYCADCTYDKAFDGDINTYVEGPQTIGYVGYDFGAGTGISLNAWKYAPRYGFAWRMDATELRGSNDPDYLNNYTVLSTISSTPAEGVLTQAPIADPTPYRYVYWAGRTDSYGNISELKLDGILTCNDPAPPTITCPENQTRATDGNCAYMIEDFTVLATNVTDGCTLSPALSQFPLAGGVINTLGPNDITLTATDEAGHSNSCSFTVTLEDQEAPTAVCQDVTVGLSNPTITLTQVHGNSTDNCSAVTPLSLSQTSFDCTEVGMQTVTLTVADEAGNEATCTATVTVQDDVAPTAGCQDVTIYLDESGSAELSPAAIDNNSTDACGIGGLSLDVSAFSCADLGTNSVILTVTDINGQQATCSATVEVIDDLAPAANCQTTDVTLDINGQYTLQEADVYDATGNADNCEIDQVNFAAATYDCTDFGQTFSVGVTVTDAVGNSTNCTAVITVADGYDSDGDGSPDCIDGCPNDPNVVIDLPFVYDGAGEFCWVTGGNINFINSWNLEYLEVNGVDYTNQWATNMPPRIDGKYFFRYKSNYAWGHFEVNGVSPSSNNTCDNAVPINLPFSKNGVGDYCWVTTDDISYVNSWNLDLLEINGVDYTNQWSNSLPPKIEGSYYIAYSTQVAWGHFEAGLLATPGAPMYDLESSSQTSNVSLDLFPNPTQGSVNLRMEGLDDRAVAITIQDHIGRVVWQQQYPSLPSLTITIDLSSGRFAAGLYMVSVVTDEEMLSKRLIVTD